MTSLFRRIFLPILPLFAALLPCGSGLAQTPDITWVSANFVENLDSAGTPLDDSYSFHLGIFNPPSPGPGEDPWMPAPENTAEWADHWITVDITPYELGINPGFSGAYDVESTVEGVSLSGRQGYIWGVNRKCPGEWILVTSAAWTFPAPGFIFPETWSVSSGIAVVGAINEGGVHIRTAPVANGLPPLLRAEDWRSLHFTANEIATQEAAVSGWLADPNNNGRVNLIEYALGTNPRSNLQADPLLTALLDSGGSHHLLLTVRHDPNTEAILSAEVSSDLQAWSAAPSAVILESEAPCELVFRDLSAVGPLHPRRFIRLRATLPTP